MKPLLYLFLGLNLLLAGAGSFLYFQHFPISPAGVPASAPTKESGKFPATVDRTGHLAVLPEAEPGPIFSANPASPHEAKRRQAAAGSAKAGTTRQQNQPPLPQQVTPQSGALAGTSMSSAATQAVPSFSQSPGQSPQATLSAGQAAAPSSSGQATADPSQKPVAAAANPPAADAVPLTLPAALVPDSPAIPITTDQQVAEWEKLQDDFVNQVGGETPNLKDVATRERWSDAQQYNDNLFRAKFGTQAYILQNLEAARQHRSQ